MVKQILQLSEFTPSSVKFSDVKKNRAGGSLVYPNVNGQNIVLQTPKLFVPFGVKEPDQKQERISAVTLTTSVKGHDQADSAQAVFAQKLAELDRMVIKEAVSNTEWHKLLGMKKGKVTEETVEMLYVPLVKVNDGYAPNVNVKMPVEYEGTAIKTELFNAKDKKQSIALTLANVSEHLPRFSEIKVLIRVGSVWFINKKFGVTLRAVQAVVYPSSGIQKEVFDVSSVVASDLSFSDVKKNKRGGSLVYPKVKGASASITLPALKAPFGVSSFENDGKASSFSLPLSLDGYQTDEATMAVHQLFTGFDEAVLDQAVENKEWHPLLGLKGKKKVSKETLEMLYSYMVRQNDEKYPPVITGKLQLDFESTKFRTVFVVNGETVEATTENVKEIIKGGMMVKVTLQLGGVWFINKKFGLSLRVEKVEAEKAPEITGYSFEDSDDEELDEEFEEESDAEESEVDEEVDGEEEEEDEEEEVSDDE